MKLLSLVLAATSVAIMSALPAFAQSAPEFKLGFKALAEQIPGVAGNPTEGEHWGANGDSLQKTTTGLMVWRKADNWTAFTDGYMTWINGPDGVQSRLNGERFAWEQATPPPAPSPAPATATPLPGPATVGLQVGNLAPDFGLRALDGSTIKLSALRGRPVVVNFWATWCPHCRSEAAVKAAVYEKYSGQGLAILGVDEQESDGTVKRFVEQGGYRWTFLLDTEGTVGNLYQVTGIPTSFFIDRNGVIRGVARGEMSQAAMEQRLKDIL